MKCKTKLAHKQLNVIHNFLTSFDTRDTWISEIAKLLLSDTTNAIPRPRLSALKEAQLCTNCRTFVLPKFKDEACPKPPNHIIKRAKIQKKEKNKVRKEKKKTRDSNVSDESSVLFAAKNA